MDRAMSSIHGPIVVVAAQPALWRGLPLLAPELSPPPDREQDLRPGRSRYTHLKRWNSTLNVSPICLVESLHRERKLRARRHYDRHDTIVSKLVLEDICTIPVGEHSEIWTIIQRQNAQKVTGRLPAVALHTSQLDRLRRT